MARKRSTPVDLSELDGAVAIQEEGVVIQVFNMDGQTPLGFGIRIAGPDSDRAKMARRGMVDDATERGSLEPLTDDERYAQATRYLARLSISFEGSARLDGQVLRNTEADFYKLYQRFRFIRNQIDQGAASREPFLREFEKRSLEPLAEPSETET